MNRLMIIVAMLLCSIPALAQQETALERLLRGEVARIPAKVGLYVKHLGTGETVSSSCPSCNHACTSLQLLLEGSAQARIAPA